MKLLLVKLSVLNIIYMSEKAKVVEQILSLMANHSITVEDLVPNYCQQITMLEENFGFRSFFSILGGILVICAMIFSVSTANVKDRATISAATGVILFIVSFYFDSTVGMVLAGLFESGGLFFQCGGMNDIQAVLALLFLQFLVAYCFNENTGSLFLLIAYAFSLLLSLLSTTINFKNEPHLIPIILGGLSMFTTYSFDEIKNKNVVPFWYFLSSASLLIGIGILVLKESSLEFIFPFTALALLLFSSLTNSRAISFNASVAMVMYMWHLIRKNLKQELGGPLTLMLVGLSIILLGYIAYG